MRQVVDFTELRLSTRGAATRNSGHAERRREAVRHPNRFVTANLTPNFRQRTGLAWQGKSQLDV